MGKLFKWLAGLVGIALLLGSAVLVNVIWFRPFSIDIFFERVFLEYALDDPELLTSIRLLEQFGLDGHNEKLTDVSLARTLQLNEQLRDNLATLREYDRGGLDPGQQLSYDVLESFLAVQVDGEPYTFHDYLVTQLSGVHINLPEFMLNQHQVASEIEAEQYLLRLNAFDTKFDQVLEQLRHRREIGILPPRFVVEKVLGQLEAFVAPPAEDNPLVSGLAEKLDAIEDLNPIRRRAILNEAERAVVDVVYPKYREMIAFFEQLAPQVRGNPGVWALPDGDAYYAHQVRLHTTTDLTPDEIHAVGLQEVARIEAAMDGLLVEQGYPDGSVGERMLELASEPRFLYPDNAEGKSTILADFQAIIDEINAGLDPYFNRRPASGVEVRPIPEFREDGAPGAYYQPPALDGSRPGVFYLNTRDLSEIPEFGMRTLAYHEAIPGHHFQIALKQELTGVPTFRKLVPFTAFSEGWALYAERLAKELGFLADPFDDLGRLQAEMFRAVRLVVDTGIHAKQWSREDAIAYMLDKTGMPEGDVIAEIERYFVNPGQALAYKVGMLTLLELRADARAALGEHFDMGEFHDVVLGQGSLPLMLLEREVQQYIAARQ
ncbi:MAG: DUF885 domain-containing protein [Xanthomonadales bacterium]|nr:DUF885 domain-containing protein [Xanthomonadales bacterium]